jgi:predicted amidohydrolase
MRTLNIAAAQFEPRNGDKQYNLFIIESLTATAKEKGAEVISFHELSITAYTFIKDLNKTELMKLAEMIPNGPSTQKLIAISKKYGIPVFAGLIEKEDGKLYNTYIGVDAGGLIVKYRKIHPFISRYLEAGNQYTVFDLKGWKFGILICYDNNVIENVRATALLGAEIIFAPHVTGCTPSAMPGRGYVDDKLWEKRILDPVPLRMEFNGPKGRGWLMRWLPARAYDNGVYYVFTNPIGYDGDQLKSGNAMILDPYGEIISESHSFDDEIIIATATDDKLTLAGGNRYTRARRPELYRDILGAPNQSRTEPIWIRTATASHYFWL